jgi:Fe-S-cluster containining protein
VKAWKAHPARAELLALYKEIDALVAPFACDASADCCHFARTGREPHVHAVELVEVLAAARAVNVPLSKKRLPVAGGPDPDRTCPMLDPAGRCRIYAARPFGCRTYFCERRTGPPKLPRAPIASVGRRIADLSARAFPRAPGPRAFSRALADEPPDIGASRQVR